jgi:hypothetical protein
MNARDERDQSLARRLTVHGFEPAAIRLGISVLGETLADLSRKSSLLVMQTLVSRAIADHLKRHGQELENDLPEMAAQALIAHSGDPLLHTAAMLVGSYSINSAERVEQVVINGLGISLNPEAVELWQTIKTGERPGLKRIAEVNGLKNWDNHPGSDQLSLYAHCRRVHANPDRATVIAIANDYAGLASIRERNPLTRKAVVRAAAWGDNPGPLLESLALNFSDYQPDILELLTGEALYTLDRYKDDWLEKMENTVAGVSGLAGLFVTRLAELDDEAKVEMSERIFATRSCPWFWLRWRDLFQTLPLNEPVAEWVAHWEGASEGSSSSSRIPPYVQAMRQLGEMPFKEIVESLPISCQAKLAAEYGGPCQHYGFARAGFAGLMEQHAVEFLPEVRPLVESGNSSLGLLNSVLQALPDEEAFRVLRCWGRQNTKETEYSLEPGEMEGLIEQLKRFDAPLPPRLQNRRGYFWELLRCGYKLRERDVSVLNPLEDMRDTRKSPPEISGGLILWDDDDNTRMVLAHKWPETEIWVVIRSVLASSQRSREEGSPVEWLERVLVPALEANPALKERLCHEAGNAVSGSSHARALLVRQDRLNQWMDAETRDNLDDYVNYNAHQMLGNEAHTLRALYPRERLIEIFRKGCVDTDGSLCELKPWLDLFESKEEIDQLVEITARRLEGKSCYDALGWVKVGGLSEYPAIQHRLEAMLDTEGDPHLVDAVTSCLEKK